MRSSAISRCGRGRCTSSPRRCGGTSTTSIRAPRAGFTPSRSASSGSASSAPRPSSTGRRKRTVYSITPAGRRALQKWLAGSIAKGPHLEFEGLLRVFLAPFGSDDDLRRTLEQIRGEIGGLLRLSALIRGEYLAGRAPFQDYAPTRAMIHDFLTHFAVLVDGWARRSLDRVESWPGLGAEDRDAVALEAFRRNTVERLSTLLDTAPGASDATEKPPAASKRRRRAPRP